MKRKNFEGVNDESSLSSPAKKICKLDSEIPLSNSEAKIKEMAKEKVNLLGKGKFNGSNFLEWERNLKIILESENKENVLDTPFPVLTATSTAEEKEQDKTIRERSRDVTGFMLLAMEPVFQEGFLEMDAYTIIRRLRNMFLPQRYKTLTAILDSRLERGKPVGPHVLNMIGLFKNLERLGFPFSQELATDIILHSLHSGFSQFIFNYNMNDMEKTMEELLDMLKTAERNIGDTEYKKDILMVQKDKRFKKRGEQKKKQKAKENDKRVVTSKTKGECFYCYGVGHWKRNCHKFLEDKKNGFLT